MARKKVPSKHEGDEKPKTKKGRTLSRGTAVALGLCALVGVGLLSPGIVLADSPTKAVGATAIANTSKDKKATSPTVSPTTSSTTSTKTSGETAEIGTLLVKLPWGSGPGQVGLFTQNEGLSHGPEALAMAPDGRVAILDSVNHRLVLLDTKGSFTNSIVLELAEPRFLAVSDTALYVLDCDSDQELATFDWNGNLQGVARLPELEDVVSGLFATDAGPCVEIAHEYTLLLGEDITAEGAPIGTTDDAANTNKTIEEDSIAENTNASSFALASTKSTITAANTKSTKKTKTHGTWKNPVQVESKKFSGRPVGKKFGPSVEVSFKTGKSANIKVHKTDKKSFKSTKTSDLSKSIYSKKNIEYLLSVDDDGQGGLVMGAFLENEETPKPGQPSIVVTRIGKKASTKDKASGTTINSTKTDADEVAATSELVHPDEVTSTDSILLSDCPFVYLGMPYATTPDGRVLQPMADANGYSLFIHTFDN